MGYAAQKRRATRENADVIRHILRESLAAAHLNLVLADVATRCLDALEGTVELSSQERLDYRRTLMDVPEAVATVQCEIERQQALLFGE